MTLPDTLEQAGIVAGSAFLLTLPTSALTAMVYGVGGPRLLPVAWLLPGFVVGPLVATDRLAVSYRQLWQFSLASYFLATLGAAVFGLRTADLLLAVGWWFFSVAFGAVVARIHWRNLFSRTVESST